ncbi:redoxin domain-containing protein [Lichenicola sp.]|uniref:redoxin domain-containing protein n=1 Tax=Lichenicola sp. TaxID=2804529 RepID=UPI003B00A2D6
MLTLVPLVGSIAVGAGFWAMLAGMRGGSFDPHDIDAPAVGRTVPDFTLPDQSPGHGFSSAELRAATQPLLVNFFASWCIPCVIEAPILSGLRTRLPIWGIAYKDQPDNAAGFVNRTGAPYARLAADRSGLTAIDWGVSGVPESFLIRPGGRIAWHVAGPLTPEIIEGQLLPALASLR